MALRRAWGIVIFALGISDQESDGQPPVHRLRFQIDTCPGAVFDVETVFRISIGEKVIIYGIDNTFVESQIRWAKEKGEDFALFKESDIEGIMVCRGEEPAFYIRFSKDLKFGELAG